MPACCVCASSDFTAVSRAAVRCRVQYSTGTVEDVGDMGTTLYPVWVAQWGRRVPKPGMHRKPPHRISRLDLDRRIAGGQGDMGTEGDSMGRT